MLLIRNFPIFLVFFILFVVLQEPVLAIKKSYIVYLGEHSHGSHTSADDLDRVSNSHYQLLGSFLGSEDKAKDAIIYSYDRHINGFAAFLEEEEAADIAKHPDVISVFLSKSKKLHTSHSWEFMMMEKNGAIHPSSIWKKARFGEDVIIANLDTGVWPEAASFTDEGIGPIPSRWKGTCQFEDKSLCNRKLIGARYFNKGYLAIGKTDNATFETPRDNDGHGSHTLSTAAGNFVTGANVLGVIVNDTIKGGSPKARVASYKVCWPELPEGGGCTDEDLLKAFDMAIQDGVDVLSVSVGGEVQDYFYDPIAIGSFHAVKNGIVVVASAGNSGPKAGSVSNVAPWIITVGASTTDREFRSDVKLKNGKIIKGMSLSPPLDDKYYTLISALDAKAANASDQHAILCMPGALDPVKVKGKILVCLRGISPRVDKSEQARLAGAVGMILCNDVNSGNDVIADAHIIPATEVTYKDGEIIFSYVNNSRNPQASLTPTAPIMYSKPAPFMAAFSSRGPNLLTSEILKPDITAPGVNIIAAYSESVGPTAELSDMRRIPFMADSGTSMSCPHVSGVVGLLKTLYPDWSPAAIRSAIMTTARTRDNTANPMVNGEDNNESTPFAYGNGHIRPNRAMNPGLVYDLSTNDYLDFLCGSGYNQTLLNQFGSGNYECPQNYSLLNFNNPSISVSSVAGLVSFTRKVKNVGTPGIYAARVRQPAGYLVSIEPEFLKFEKIGEEKVFKILVKKTGNSMNGYKFGGLTWSDGIHYVRSPIVIGEPEMSD